MAIPAFVGAGAGVSILTGTGTVSKTGCTAGNVILMHFRVRGTSEDWSDANEVNIENLAGEPNGHSVIVASEGGLFISRVMANGTCSHDLVVGASGEDIYARMYEFSGVSSGTTVAAVVENGAGTYDASSATGVEVSDPPPLVTNGADRLALAFVALHSEQAIGSFTGETGGDWEEAVAEYASGSGATCTLQLQTADMASAGTIDGGSFTVGSSTFWISIGTALLPSTLGRTYKRLYGPAQLTDTAADLYTCPASTVARTLHIHASNPSGSPVDVNLSIGTDAAGTRVWDDLEIPADGVEDVFDPYELAAGEKIQGWAASAGTVVVTITGYEDPV